MPLPRYEEIYVWWLRKLTEKRAEQYACKYPDPHPWRRPLSKLRWALVLLLALLSCGLVWAACRAIVGG